MNNDERLTMIEVDRLLEAAEQVLNKGKINAGWKRVMDARTKLAALLVENASNSFDFATGTPPTFDDELKYPVVARVLGTEVGWHAT